MLNIKSIIFLSLLLLFSQPCFAFFEGAFDPGRVLLVGLLLLLCLLVIQCAPGALFVCLSQKNKRLKLIGISCGIVFILDLILALVIFVVTFVLYKINPDSINDHEILKALLIICAFSLFSFVFLGPSFGKKILNRHRLKNSST